MYKCLAYHLESLLITKSATTTTKTFLGSMNNNIYVY